MFQLITGGSGSGKSEYAEEFLLKHSNERYPRFYLATMEPFGEETERKIERHRRMRQGKGFQTVECYTDLASLVKAEEFSQGAVLLECMSNLTANEVYYHLTEASSELALAEKIFQGVEDLRKSCSCLVVVTNEVCSECAEDTPQMQCYKRILSMVNLKMALAADEVTEVVYGIPVNIKKNGER